MELGSQQQNGVLVNTTRAAEALSKLLSNSRRTIIQVEALVTVAAALLFLQLVLGTWKRRWPNAFVSAALSVCNALLLPLVFYTFSIMQSSPVKNSMYPVWGASLLMAACGTIVVSPFDYDEKKNKILMQQVTVLARYIFYFFMLLLLMSPYSFKESWVRASRLQFQKTHMSTSSIYIETLLMALYITKLMGNLGSVIRNKLLERMMLDANGHQSDADNETMKGDKYPLGYAIRCLSRPKVEVISIDHIWGCCGNSARGETLENVCLSLALCQFFIQRYEGLSNAQARLDTTHHSVFKWLLQTEEHYQRAFRIIEMELGFCYDYFFTNYHRIYFGTVLHFPLFLCRVILITLVLVCTVQGSVTNLTPVPMVQVQITRADNIITVVLLGTALVVELLQALVYLASDWIKVSLACRYVKHEPNAFLEKLVGFFSRVAIFSLRRNRIAQYTVILPPKFFFTFPKCNLDSVEISPETEKAIAGSIKSTFGEPTNRLASQVRNSMFEHRALQEHWTLTGHSQVEIMLIWHIATDYCHHLSPSSGDGSNPDRHVAVTLSRYCAYLLLFVPQLLPYYVADIRQSVFTMMKEKAKNFRSYRPSEWYKKMKELPEDPPTVFRKGVKLGKQLKDMPDEEQPWKAMAEFWAKTIIYIAPSHTTAKEHMRQLEKGGEFLTHIWALLSHAGILNLVRDDDEVAKPAQAQPQPAQEAVSAQGQPAQETVSAQAQPAQEIV